MLNEQPLQEYWKQLMQNFGFDAHIDCYQQLLDAYSETHRYYHDIKHLTMCLQILEKIPANCLSSPRLRAEVALSLWFHDAVYQTQMLDGVMIDNEAKSAEWAYTFVVKASHNEDLAQRIKQGIIATKHNSQMEDFTEDDLRAWLLDIDLAILGTKAHIYDQFEKQIRQEYAWVPWQTFRHTRLSILQQFLQSPKLYHTHYFQQHYEVFARENLHRQIHQLKHS